MEIKGKPDLRSNYKCILYTCQAIGQFPGVWTHGRHRNDEICACLIWLCQAA